MANTPVEEGVCVTGFPGCRPYDCTVEGTCETVEVHRSQGFTHTISTDYLLRFLGHEIPIVKTRRIAEADWSVERDAPIKTNGIYDAYDVLQPLRCEEHGADVLTGYFKESCVIEKSTIHYLDHRYGVCLYKYVRQSLKFESPQRDGEQALFHLPYQSPYFHRIRVMQEDVEEQTYRVEWRLIINGVSTVIDSADLDVSFLGGTYPVPGGESELFPDYQRPPGIHYILVLPQPPSEGIVQSPLECGTPWYDYTNLPGGESELAIADGGKDMFYPEWCRSMQEDPIWREAADRRYSAKWFHTPAEANRVWTPPAVSVDPIPRGSFVSHPEVGRVYQFLTDMYGDTSEVAPKITSVPDFAPTIAYNLAAGQDLGESTLYYPISLR